MGSEMCIRDRPKRSMARWRSQTIGQQVYEEPLDRVMIVGSTRGAGVADEDVQLRNLNAQAAASSRNPDHPPEATISVEALVGQQRLPRGGSEEENVKQTGTCGPADVKAAAPEGDIQRTDVTASVTLELTGLDNVQRMGLHVRDNELQPQLTVNDERRADCRKTRRLSLIHI